MIIVAGHVTVDPDQREAYLANSARIMQWARALPGCLDVTIAGDLLDPARVNVYERWESREAVDAARAEGPGIEPSVSPLSAMVADYDVTQVRSFMGNESP